MRYLTRIPIFVALPAISLAVIFATGLGLAGNVAAQQPKEDAVTLDKDGCTVAVAWIDGAQVAQKVTISVDGIVIQTINLDDIVGDQSATLATITGAEGEAIRARLYVDGEINDEEVTTITRCPTATPTPTQTATPAPATPTATPIPPTATPIPPTPQVIIVEVPAPATPAPTVKPPATGDGGLSK